MMLQATFYNARGDTLGEAQAFNPEHGNQVRIPEDALYFEIDVLYHMPEEISR